MAKYLFEATYTPDGLSGLKNAGARSRVNAIEEMCSGVGGKLESFHFAFGDVDVFAICELPDDETAAAVSFTIGAAGAVGLKTVKLLSPEQADNAIARSVGYRPPGS